MMQQRLLTLSRSFLCRMACGQANIEPTLEPEQATLELGQKNSQKIPEEPKASKIFDHSKYNRRHVALRLAYLGADYSGFAIQEEPQVTIEKCLFDVLKRTKLIEDSRSCNYFRCGRTDTGVSAFAQVVSLYMRSNLLEGPGVIVPEGSKAHTRQGETTKELPYMIMLNRNLPPDIRVLDWAAVDPDFNARFSCISRTYKYFFPRGNMNLDVMRQAAQAFIGQHDFRNFCKMDINGGVTRFERTIYSLDISPLDEGAPSPYQLCVATINAKAFLMHQIRCMMAILFLIGNGLEDPSIIGHMLDLERCPRKPQYGMADPEPLVLFDTQFEGVNWEGEERERENLVAHFQKQWTRHAIKTAMIQQLLETSLLTTPSSSSSHMAPLMHSDHKLGSKTYKPLLKRPTSDGFEERYEHYLAKKRKLAESTPVETDE